MRDFRFKKAVQAAGLEVRYEGKIAEVYGRKVWGGSVFKIFEHCYHYFTNCFHVYQMVIGLLARSRVAGLYLYEDVFEKPCEALRGKCEIFKSDGADTEFVPRPERGGKWERADAPYLPLSIL